MTAMNALVLGLVQGIAEFLPISSSGHLELFKEYLGLSEVPLLFDVILHLATLLVVLIVFRARIAAMFVALWKFATGGFRMTRKTAGADGAAEKVDENLPIILPFLIATAITAIIGVFIEKFVDQGGPVAVSIRLLVTAAILGLTALLKPGKRNISSIGAGRACLIGVAQGIGVFSGISRSGITISAGLFAGLDRGAAGEFSFLLSIPAILGAFLLTAGDAGAMTAAVSPVQLALAFVTAFISGFAALKLLLWLVRKGRLYWFAPYLVVVGALGLILFS